MAFLVQSTADDMLYALVGKPAPGQWCSLQTMPPPADEQPDDELDFEMF